MIPNSDRQDKYYCFSLRVSVCVQHNFISDGMKRKAFNCIHTEYLCRVKTAPRRRNTNASICIALNTGRRIGAQLVHRDVVKLQCLTRVRCLCLSACVNARPTQKEYCHLLVHLFMSHWKPPALFLPREQTLHRHIKYKQQLLFGVGNL